jgi:hypothetical protein
MAMLDIFHSDPFTSIQLTAAVERVPFQPIGLGTLDIFDPMPIRTKALAVEERTGKLSLLQTTARGAPPSQRTLERRKIRYFDVPRIAQDDTVTADELQSIRAFGTESEFMQVQAEVARRLNGPTGILRNIEYTLENMRLGAVQGLLTDADGTQLYSWFDEFGITAATEVAFNLSAALSNTIRPIINGIVRNMARAAQGAFAPDTEVIALCGDVFYDQFVNHPDVIRTFLNWQAAADIRDGSQGSAFGAFKFSGVTWMNYRGSDDNTTIKIPDAKVKFFPRGAPGLFQMAYAPAETFDFVNTPGKPVYIIPVFDRDRNAWWRVEAYSYPLPICTRPEVLQSGRAGT